MIDEMDASAREWAATRVRSFADATNLLIAGRRFAIRGSGARARALSRLLAAIGARPVVAGESPDYLFCTGEAVEPLRLDDLRGLDGLDELSGLDGLDGLDLESGPPLLLIADASAIDEQGFAPLREVRSGVYATASQGLFVVHPHGSANAFRSDDAAAARERIEWARRFMPVSVGLAAELTDTGAVEGLRVGLSMVLEPKTAVLALVLKDAGAEVRVFAHPDETDDAVASALRDAGIPVYAQSNADPSEHLDLALAFLDQRPQLLIDDGSHLIRLAHTSRPDIVDGLIGAAEETTSGLRPLREMAALGSLRTPVVAVNDARSKTLFDNRYGTGQSCLFAILGLLALDTAADLTGRTVVVAGYGHVGEGVAHHARALGAVVVVAEIDPVRALQATFDGHRVAPLITAVETADVVVSATGLRDTISLAVLLACAPDAVVAVAGGVPQEVATDDAVAAGAVRETIRAKTERFRFVGGGSVLVLDDGAAINITAGEGNPIEIMDLSFAVQLRAIRYLVETEGSLAPGVHELPAHADDEVAAAALRQAGVAIDPAPDKFHTIVGWPSTRFDGTSA